MRIIHFADLHIGVENFGRIDPATGMSTRLQDFLAALDELVAYALANDVDLVLFAGDAYKSRDPSQTQQREFARRIARLTAAGGPVYLLVGNHDLPYAAGRATAVDIFDTLSVPLVTVGRRVGTQVLTTRRGERLQIVGVPWVNRSWLLTQDEYRALPPDALNEAVEEKLAGLLAVEFDRLDRELPAVLSGHLSHAEAVPGSERRMMVGADPIFLTSTLTSIHGNIEYAALGHIHQRQVYQSRYPLVYSGSMQRVDFGEEGQTKGFYVIDIDPSLPPGERLRDFQFVEVTARAFVTIAVRATAANPTDDVLRAIQRRERDIAGAVVRVQVTVSSGREGLLDDMAIRRALAAAHYMAGISREVEGAQRARIGSVRTEGLAPGRALELYLELKDIKGERAKELTDYGRRLVAQVDTGIDQAEGAGATPAGVGSETGHE